MEEGPTPVFSGRSRIRLRHSRLYAWLAKCRDVSGLGWLTLSLLLGGCVAPDRVESTADLLEDRAKTFGEWDFDLDQVGAVPSGWSVHETNPGEALATWAVISDRGAPSGRQVLALTETVNYNGTYNLAVAEDTSYRDLDLTVRVKAVKGKEDQGGGPIWRCRDEKNYYICRINPLERNYRVYVVSNGKRRQLDSANVLLDTERWYTIRVTMVGDRIRCYLDGRKLLEVQDTRLPGAGTIGLWTKADAVTSFDDLAATSLDTTR